MSKKVLVIDDSAYSRQALKSMLEAIPWVKSVETAVDGVDGLRQAVRAQPDIIMLDLEMPNMDGFTFLRLLNGVKRRVPVIVISGRHGTDGEASAFRLGATDFIKKPLRFHSAGFSSIQGEISRIARFLPEGRAEGRESPDLESGCRPADVDLTPEAVVIGASTGGPVAISSIIRSLPRNYPAAVSVALHMPHWMAAAFVERLNASSSMRVRIAGDGEKVEKGVVVVAPGGVHLSFIRKKGSVYTILTGKRTSDISVPSIDRMFSSASEVWGAALIGVVLTGMGRDGVMGVEAIKDAGGVVIAESEESAAVPSMPKAAAATGKVALTMPAHRIGMWLAGRRQWVKAGKPPIESIGGISPETVLKKERISGILA